MLSKDEDDITEEINSDLLKIKRFLFVGRGHASDIIGKLKREFPGSIFLTENTRDISNIKVDGIVMLIKTMKHSMYYKVKMSSVFREVETVNCYSNNYNNVIYNMNKAFIL